MSLIQAPSGNFYSFLDLAATSMKSYPLTRLNSSLLTRFPPINNDYIIT